jgi:hypothetical protein
MTAEEARRILNMYSERIQAKLNIYFTFPIDDKVIHIELKGNEIIEYTFLHLIKIAYNLEESKA